MNGVITRQEEKLRNVLRSEQHRVLLHAFTKIKHPFPIKIPFEVLLNAIWERGFCYDVMKYLTVYLQNRDMMVDKKEWISYFDMLN